MENVNNINIGSKILSIAIATGFLAFLLLILRTVIISANTFIIRFREKNIEKVNIADSNHNKGF
tara:strand:- start:454 stop:645 length:192 start_codon:yes stop_codon:yes gene_type:complete